MSKREREQHVFEETVVHDHVRERMPIQSKLEDEEGLIGGIELFLVPLHYVFMEFLELVSGFHITECRLQL